MKLVCVRSTTASPPQWAVTEAAELVQHTGPFEGLQLLNLLSRRFDFSS